jgi:hypothetical protein
MAEAVRSFFENQGKYAEPGQYAIYCAPDATDKGARRLEIVWKPPLVFFPCQFCQGRGEIRGTNGHRQLCPRCHGHSMSPV